MFDSPFISRKAVSEAQHSDHNNVGKPVENILK